jgi:hypothetical protein
VHAFERGDKAGRRQFVLQHVNHAGGSEPTGLLPIVDVVAEPLLVTCPSSLNRSAPVVGTCV